MIYRAKFVPTVFAARQFVNHGHIRVNGRRVNIASYQVKVGDLIEIKESSRQLPLVMEANALAERDVPDYVEVDHPKGTAKLTRVPGLIRGAVSDAYGAEPRHRVLFALTIKWGSAEASPAASTLARPLGSAAFSRSPTARGRRAKAGKRPQDLQDPMPIPRSGTAGLGVVLYLAGVAMFAVNDALGKWLVKDYGVGQLMLLRTIGAGVVLAPMVLSLRVKLIDLRRPALQVLRILCAAADTFAFYYATRIHAARRRDDLLYGDAADRHRALGAPPRREGRALSLDRRPGRLRWRPSSRSGPRRTCSPGLRPSRSWERSPMR